ncbi:MAG: FAD-binding domain-containing protein [Pseudomonadota bacterium]
MTTIWWIKRDARLIDNPALSWALSTSDCVVPVFIVEPDHLQAPETSAFHVAAWREALADLRQSLRAAGGDLCVLYGDAIEVLERLHTAIGFGCIVSHEEVGLEWTFSRDRAVADWCVKRGIRWQEHAQTGVFRPSPSRDQRGQLWREWMLKTPLERPDQQALRHIVVPTIVRALQADSERAQPASTLVLTSAQQSQRQPVSESHGLETLDDFLTARAIAYRGGISSPNTAFTAGSRLSVHLAWGTLSSRYVYHRLDARVAALKGERGEAAKRWRASLNAFRARLHWRDHFMQRLEAEPAMQRVPLNRAYEALPYRDDAKRLAAWQHGRTGWPLVDACIRCVQQTGFLNFRMRSMITSAACHALHIDWRIVQWPLAQWWADYEPGIHVSQVQMQAGVVGINTLRTYNPAKQIIDQDPEAVFIRRWVPELANESVARIVAHQTDGSANYIEPVVDFATASRQMRDAYYAIRRQPETRELAQAVMKKHGSRKKTIRKSRSRTRRADDSGQLRLL